MTPIKDAPSICTQLAIEVLQEQFSGDARIVSVDFSLKPRRWHRNQLEYGKLSAANQLNEQLTRGFRIR
jgi:hypothetical protein